MSGAPPTVPTQLRRQVGATLAGHWRPAGYTSPNLDTYPWQWLWDSCFHAVIWARLGRPDRAVAELTTTLAPIDADGFLPHVRYHGDPTHHAGFWGRVATSSITQPPMYGHALAELHRAGVELPGRLRERAGAGLRFLLGRRARVDGLVGVVHPWETGCDDSPRWDHWSPDGYDRTGFRELKGTFMATIERSASGAPLANPGFPVGSVGFNALVAFNARELASVTGDDTLSGAADALADRLGERWSGESTTWVDTGPHATGSGRVRTADALLPLLVVQDEGQADAAFAELADPGALGGPHGPAGTDRREPTYDPDAYWRGPCWPQLAYLLWVAAHRAGRRADADRLAATTIAGAEVSELAEYWNPDSGAGGGAVPQSWAGLVLLMDDRGPTGDGGGPGSAP